MYIFSSFSTRTPVLHPAHERDTIMFNINQSYSLFLLLWVSKQGKLHTSVASTLLTLRDICSDGSVLPDRGYQLVELWVFAHVNAEPFEIA